MARVPTPPQQPFARTIIGRLSSVGFARLSPVLWVAVLVVLDLASPSNVRFDRVLAAAPALASSTWSVRGTAGFGLFAFAAEFALSFTRGGPLQGPAMTTLLVIAAVTVASCYAGQVRLRRERDLAEVRSVVATVQRVVLRPLPRHLGTVDLDLLYLASAAQAEIGGDFYEAIHTPYGVRVILGDVQGKGLSAVETAAVLLASFREAAYDLPDLPALARRLETSMVRYAERASSPDAAERFATTVLAEIPDDRPVIHVLNCGHPPPLLLHDGELRILEPEQSLLPVNLSSLLDSDYRSETHPFGPGDRILLYTDGVSETRDRAGEFFPLVDRVRATGSGPPEQVLRRLRTELLAHGAGVIDDDVAALLVLRCADPGGTITVPSDHDGAGGPR